jgi:cytochrome c oxidase cbb3-type subunit 3
MFKYKNIIFAAITLCIGNAGYAQDPTSAVTTTKAPTNYLEVLMIVIAGLLVIVIWVLSNVLSMIAKKAVEITKAGNKVMMIGWIVLGSLFANAASAQTEVTDTATKVPEVNYYGGLSSFTFWTLSTVLALELLVIFLMLFFIRGLWKSINPSQIIEIEGKQVKQSWLLRNWNTLDKKFLTKAVPLEKEADMLLDHDYDGIKELDNALPPWWKYGFYITIVVGVFYLLKFEVWKTGQDQYQEYTTEMTEAKAATEAYLAEMKENVDEKTVVMLDAAGVSAGKELFAKTCVACHMSNGEGGVGPNLTDDYWIHGGSINDVFKTIKYGYPDKGMQAWSSTYSPVQIQQLSSYIKSLKGTHPANAKAPQGDLYTEVASKDSVKIAVVDSVATK